MQREHYSSQLGFKLGAAWRHSGNVYRRHLPEGVSLSQAYVLEALPPKKAIAMGEISEALGMDLPAVSSLVARMERTGLLMREANANDRRQVLVRVTAEGGRVRRLARNSLVKADSELRETISHTDIRNLARLMDLLRSIDARHAHPSRLPGPA
jgi:MarR family transcriptional regulator, organic hydroperoxide resistance regulator